jgi:hypothetical protein
MRELLFVKSIITNIATMQNVEILSAKFNVYKLDT